MIQITTDIIIKGKSPMQIFDWLSNLNQERYVQWHPNAHKDFKWIRKTKDFVGSIIYFNEVFDGYRVNCKWEILETKKDESNLMKAKTFYPIYLRLSVKKIIGEDTEVTHELLLGFSFYGLEKFFDWFVRKFIFTEVRREALKRHAMEEFKNLEKII